jgi:hypothetical protein
MSKHHLVLGFYDRSNLGDECYKLVIPRLDPKSRFSFVCMDDVDDIVKLDLARYDTLICGGGDIINSYFMERFRRVRSAFNGPCIALSVGIPYDQGIEYLDLFDHIIVRSFNDYELACTRIPQWRVTYFPDFVFALSLPFYKAPPSFVKVKTRKNIAFCLAQPMFHNNPNKAQMISDILTLIAQFPNCNIHLVPFNTFEGNDAESDVVICRELFPLIERVSIHIEKDPIKVMKILSTMNLVICSRYHSVVFSMIVGVPFVAVYTSRKIKSLLECMNAQNHGFQLPMDSNDKPISFVRSISQIANGRLVKRMASKSLKQLWSWLSLFLNNRKIIEKRTPYFELRPQPPLDWDACQQFIAEIPQDAVSRGSAVCYFATGKLSTEYQWGLREKLEANADHPIKQDYEWIHDDFSKKPGFKPYKECYSVPVIRNIPIRISFDSLFDQTDFYGFHRSGWSYATESLRSAIENNATTTEEIFVDFFVDRTFHWAHDILTAKGVLPYKTQWIGFIHHTFDTSYSKYNCRTLVENAMFIESLKTCRGLIVLSHDLREKLRRELFARGMFCNVYTMTHPMEPVVGSRWSIEQYRQNQERKLVQIGAWLRNPFAIYDLQLPVNCGVKKAMLIGKSMGNMKPPSTALSMHPQADSNKFMEGFMEAMKQKLASVEILEKLDEESYDDLLRKNIVFLNLVDCSAVNTVLECILRCTPVIVNRLPALEEVLGTRYPGFYESLHEAVCKASSTETIIEINYYLRSLDKTRFTIEYFVNSFENILMHIAKLR